MCNYPCPFNTVKRKEITCFTFDDGFTGTSGEWVSRTKTVDLVNRDCVSDLCAYFPGVRSRLEVPRFTAAFEAWGEFSISFWLKNLDDGPSGIITNGDCNPGETPSLFVYGGWSEQLKVGMMGNGGYVATATVPMVSVKHLFCARNLLLLLNTNYLHRCVNNSLT